MKGLQASGFVFVVEFCHIFIKRLLQVLSCVIVVEFCDISCVIVVEFFHIFMKGLFHVFLKWASGRG